MVKSDQGARMRRGLAVLIVLVVLTALEYWVAAALQTGVMPYLAVIAVIKAGLIVQYFMHLSQLWSSEE